MRNQLGLFGPAEPPAVASATVPESLHILARQMPANLHLGTSSWAFPGWDGIVYEGKYPQSRLSNSGLRAYARHPLLTGAGIDRSYYRPLSVDDCMNYAQQVPQAFQFVVKAHELSTIHTYPMHRRYGDKAGKGNPLFLDPGYLLEEVVSPLGQGFATQPFVLLFQFTPGLNTESIEEHDFLAALHRCLSRLPVSLSWAVELRSRSLFSGAYLQVLQELGGVHCITAHPTMPPPIEQWRLMGGRTDPLLIRWMLHLRYGYDEARSAYHPFARLVDPDPQTRRQLARICSEARGASSVTVIANNKAEGCAPRTLFALAEEIARS